MTKPNKYEVSCYIQRLRKTDLKNFFIQEKKRNQTLCERYPIMCTSKLKYPMILMILKVLLKIRSVRKIIKNKIYSNNLLKIE